MSERVHKARATSVRLEKAFLEQIEFLKAIGYGNTSGIVQIALDRMFVDERGRMEAEKRCRCCRLLGDNR